MDAQKKISPETLVAMDEFAGEEKGLRIDQVYKDGAHPENIFGAAIYRAEAKFYLHEILVPILVLAGEEAAANGVTLVLKDGLRTTEAQALMAETEISKANPHWFQEPRLLSAPGQGAHPRGMAFDVTMVRSGTNEMFDCGTPFDYLTPDPTHNPAERHHEHLSAEARANRQLLDDLVLGAANSIGVPLHPLSTEWWDYRMPMDFWKIYAPLSDAELPPEMRMAAI